MNGLLNKFFPPYDGPKLPAGKLTILGLQHCFTMFGATVLVPLITGISVSVALFMAGVCTLWFHFVSKGKVPIFLGSSFAFIAPILLVSELFGIEYAFGGIVVSGAVYCVMALLVYLLGAKRIMNLFPPIVTGPIIMIIGLMLAPIAIMNAGTNWGLAIISFAVVAGVSVFVKGFVKVIPVICGLVVGYIFAMAFGQVDFVPVAEARWIGFPDFVIAKFDWRAILIVVPVAIATTVEHIGDIVSISAITGKDLMKDPGMHRTLLGDGVASSISAMFGGPANTTYSENTGVLALTKVYNPLVMRIAAVFAIFLALFPKLSAIISTIPAGVIGGISIVLFGMIAAVGARNLVENKVDFKSSRNLLIMAVIMVLGLGGAAIAFTAGDAEFALSGVGLAAIVGIILNKILPEEKEGTEE
jgi:uracil permease